MTRSAVFSCWRALAFASLLAVAVPVPAQDEGEFADEMESHLDALEKHNASDGLAPVPTMQAPADAATGREAEIARVVRDMINDMSGVQNAYVRRIAELGLERLLDPVRLGEDRDMVEGRRILAEARAAADTALADSLGVIDAMPARIDAASLGAADKADMMRGFERSMPAARERIRRQFDLEVAAYAEMVTLLDLLADAEWEYVDEQLVFAEDADANTYNVAMAKIDAIVAEQSRMQTEQIQEARGKVEQLRD